MTAKRAMISSVATHTGIIASYYKKRSSSINAGRAPRRRLAEMISCNRKTPAGAELPPGGAIAVPLEHDPSSRAVAACSSTGHLLVDAWTGHIYVSNACMAGAPACMHACMRTVVYMRGISWSCSGSHTTYELSGRVTVLAALGSVISTARRSRSSSCAAASEAPQVFVIPPRPCIGREWSLASHAGCVHGEGDSRRDCAHAHIQCA
jgi:hypothetical protein